MAASDNFRLVNSSEKAIPKYIPGMAADIKGLREELDKKFEVGVQIDATTRDLIAQAPAGTMGKGELDKIAMETTQQLDEIAKKGDYEHYTRPLMALGRNVHGKLGAIANDAKQEATYYDEIDKYKGWTESQKNDMKTKALVGSKPLQFDEMGRKVGGFKSGENWGDLPDPDEATREVLSMLGPDKYGVTEDIGTLYKKYKEGTIYETIGIDKIRQAFDSAAKTPGTKLYQYLDKQSRLQTFANTNGVDDKTAYDFFQNKFTPTGVNEDEIASEQLLKDKVLRGEKSPTLALQQLTNKDVYNTLYGNIFNYAATKQVSSITKEIKTEASPYELEELKDVYEQKKEARAKAAKEEEEGPVYIAQGATVELDPNLASYESADKAYQDAQKVEKSATERLDIVNKILSNKALAPTAAQQYYVEKANLERTLTDAKNNKTKYLGAVTASLDAAAAANGYNSYSAFISANNSKITSLVSKMPKVELEWTDAREVKNVETLIGRSLSSKNGKLTLTGEEARKVLTKYPNFSVGQPTLNRSFVKIPGLGKIKVESDNPYFDSKSDDQLDMILAERKKIEKQAATTYTKGQGSTQTFDMTIPKSNKEIIGSLRNVPTKDAAGKSVTNITPEDITAFTYSPITKTVIGKITTGEGKKKTEETYTWDVSSTNSQENLIKAFAKSSTPSAKEIAYNMSKGTYDYLFKELSTGRPITKKRDGSGNLKIGNKNVQIVYTPSATGTSYQLLSVDEKTPIYYTDENGKPTANPQPMITTQTEEVIKWINTLND